jgi:WD40 repeat protein
MRFLGVLALLTYATIVAASTTSLPTKSPRLDRHGDPLPDGALVRLGTVRFQPAGDFVASALSPDGLTLAVATRGSKSEGTRVDFMDTATGKSLRHLDLADFSTNPFHDTSMQFTPDGQGLVLNGWFGIIQYDIATGKSAWSIDAAGQSYEAVALSADNKRVALQTMEFVKDAPVRIWEVATKKEVAVLPGRGAWCKSLTFGVDGKRVLLWSIVPNSVGADGSLGYTNQAKAALVCIDIGADKIVGETTAGFSQSVALCPDGETIALEEADHRSVRILHLPSATERCTIAVKQAKLAFGPDGKVLLTIDQAGRATLWDTTKGTKIRDLEGNLVHGDHRIVGFSKNGKTIAVLDGGWDSAPTVVVWNADTGQRSKRPLGHVGAVTCLSYARSGKLLATGSSDKTVRLWNPTTGEHLRLLTEHRDAITAVAFSPDGKLLASSSRDGVTRVSKVAAGQGVIDFDGPDRGATALAFAPDGKVLFAGSHSPEVLAWEIASNKEVSRFRTGDDGSVVAFTDGGALALTANGEIRAEDTPERLQLWSTSKKQPIAAIPLRGDDRTGKVRCPAAVCSPDGRLIAASQVSEFQGERPFYGAALLRVWERASGEPILTLGPTVTKVLAFSWNGRLLASGGAGKPGHLNVGYGSGIDIWDAVTGKKLSALPISRQCLAFSPDGTQLAMGGREQDVLIWEVPPTQLPNLPKAPSAAQREAWWTALGGKATDAYQAIGQLLDAPDHAVALLKERVQPVQPQDADGVIQLIALLDSGKFAERNQAQATLEKMGEGAVATIKMALAGKVTLETRRRLELLLHKCDATSAASLRHYRVVATLEWIGTPAARALLQTLAEGAPDARLTTEARAALKRLQV